VTRKMHFTHLKENERNAGLGLDDLYHDREPAGGSSYPLHAAAGSVDPTFLHGFPRAKGQGVFYLDRKDF